jgi:RimJ/RimL family protein N-acetyltransferase
MSTRPPDSHETPRLVLERWRPDHAPALLPLLEANVSRLEPWIPWRVAQPVPLPRLRERLAGFSRAFDEDREWRYAVHHAATRELLGEVDLFPRDPEARVALANADRVEVGYWLRGDAQGLGYATEAAAAAMALGLALPGIWRAEIRCDEANAASAAVPRRLGFHLARTIAAPAAAPGDEAVQLQVWEWLPRRHTMEE